MKKLLLLKWVIPAVLLVCSIFIVWLAVTDEEVDFNTQVKPIINTHCISCHGGVKQNGGFSLLFEIEAKGNTDSGKPAIIPGDADNSELIRRLVSVDPEVRMPYQKNPLTKEEIDIVKRWINQGAKWDTHWAYERVADVAVPNKFEDEKQFSSWKNNDIDNFIFEKLQELQLHPNPEADVPTLAVRLALDLTGLPPSEELFHQLSSNPSSEAWATYVDTLLASKHYGEKWAGMWMDLARYADTKGYERDDSRTIWKYRDWLIRAFNEDLPYDRFLTEQIAGDLLPNPSDDQLIATAFHRNTMTNDEGGTDNEEFRVEAVLDRVNTTWEVTMGTTFACVQCHSHPYDPFKQEDYYKFAAFFNNTRDEDTYDDYPVLRHFEGEDSINLVGLNSWLVDHIEDNKANEIITFLKTYQPSINSLTSTDFINAELADTKWLVLRDRGSAKFSHVNLDGKNTLIYKYRSFLSGGIWKIYLDSLKGTLLKEIKVDDTNKKWAYNEIVFPESNGVHDLYFAYRNPNLKDATSNGLMFDWLHFTDEFPGKETEGYQTARSAFDKLLVAQTLQTPIMFENPPDMSRATYVFERGNWLDRGQQVQPNVPEIMNPLPKDAEANRLGLALWLVDPQNPLTARTYVNRIWEQIFGLGIVETLEDFGSRGTSPSHRKLLDHLSWRFMHDFNWSTKKLIKYIVSSASYRQSSVRTPEELQTDPQNRYYASGPRIRLSAEQIRDRSLAVSGLLSNKMFGPSVMPYQPEGIWNSPYNGLKWKKSKGEDQYRRAVYTYWKRTGPYPSMVLFDVMAREVCSARRIRTNTPLQALVTLNDSVFTESSLHFAKRMIREGGNDPEDQIKYGYRLMMYKDISREKLRVLLNLYSNLIGENLIRNAAAVDKETANQKHFQSMFIVANTMMNLDEFLTKN